MSRLTQRILLAFLGAGVVTFGLASLVHSGVLVGGYVDPGATIAEGVIAVALAVGLVGAWSAPRRARAFALASQGFALFGTCIGTTLVLLGIGPRTAFDVALHVVMLSLLVAGLVAAARSPRSAERA